MYCVRASDARSFPRRVTCLANEFPSIDLSVQRNSTRSGVLWCLDTRPSLARAEEQSEVYRERNREACQREICNQLRRYYVRLSRSGQWFASLRRVHARAHERASRCDNKATHRHNSGLLDFRHVNDIVRIPSRTFRTPTARYDPRCMRSLGHVALDTRPDCDSLRKIRHPREMTRGSWMFGSRSYCSVRRWNLNERANATRGLWWTSKRNEIQTSRVYSANFRAFRNSTLTMFKDNQCCAMRIPEISKVELTISSFSYSKLEVVV